VLTPLWALGTWLARRRRPQLDEQDVRRHIYRDQTRSMGVRLTERLRDRLRPRWLRLRSEQ